MRPEVGPVAERLYEELEPLAFADEENDWALLHYCEAIGSMLDEVEWYVRDSDDGPGWSLAVDPDRSPLRAFPWLAQFVGVSNIPKSPSETDEEYTERFRSLIKARVGFERGTRGAMEAIVNGGLTGEKTVVFRERHESAYKLTIRTKLSETIDPAATERALREQKPAGIILIYQAAVGPDYQQIEDAFDTYADLAAEYATYGDMSTDFPT